MTDAHPGRLPHPLSFLEVEPDQLVVSAVKPAEQGEGMVVRVYNPCDGDVAARLRWHRPLHTAERVSLEEQTVEQLAWDAATLDIPVRPAEILTLRVTFRDPEPE